MSAYKDNPSSSVFTLCSDNPGVFMFQRCRWRWISRDEGENRVFTRLTFVSCCRGRRISQVACYRTRLICPQRKKRRVRQHSGAVLRLLCVDSSRSGVAGGGRCSGRKSRAVSCSPTSANRRPGFVKTPAASPNRNIPFISRHPASVPGPLFRIWHAMRIPVISVAV